MANKVIQNNEVFLDGKYYPINRPVQQVLASIYPAKVVIGDTTQDSQIRASVISWSDFRGGIGVERMEGAKDVDRAWWSTCSLRYKRHLVLPAKTKSVTNGDSNTSSQSLDILQEFNGSLYGVWGNNKVYKFNPGAANSGGFTAALATLPDTATDALEVRMGGTLYLVIAHTGGYTYTSDASSFTDDTKDTKYLTFWEDKLWGIDNTGQLWHAATIGSETNDAKLPLPDGFVTDLFIARNASGDPIIYAMTKEGLYAHDSSNSRFVETQLALPFHNDNGKGSVRWRDSVYIPAGLGIYKYINGSNSAVVTVVGPDKDHGLKEDYRGGITKLLGTHNDLITIVDGSLSPGYADFLATGSSASIPDSTGYSSILGWNEIGWEVKWAGTIVGESITSAFVTDVGGDISSTNPYRLYWGYNSKLYYQQLQSDVINPTQVVNYSYEDSVDGTFETPWFNADQIEVKKLALKLKLETATCDANQTVVVAYALDYEDDDDDYTSMGTITSNGITPYTFGSSLGTTFRAIKFKLTLASNTTNFSPDVISMTLEFRKKLDTKFGWAINIDMTKPYKGRSPKSMRTDLLSAIESNTLLEFTYRDDNTTDENGKASRNYYVDIQSAQGLEHTAYDERGATHLTLTEP
tara:strand:- start:102 stop:2009 length:1908 start_codon:yes stop_codon:yes gene_type:complete